MSGQKFATSAPLNADSYTISPSGALDGQSLIYDGTKYLPQDIVPVGTIEMWAGTVSNVPIGWLLCDGVPYGWSEYTRLRDVIGIAYGGSLDTSWNVPNMISTSSVVVAPIGLAGGANRGSVDKLFSAGSTAHVHNYSQASAYTSLENTNDWTHNHANENTSGAHTHNSPTDNWSHSHQVSQPLTSHTHNYQRGTGTVNGTNSGGADHGGHNTSNTTHGHDHGFLAADHAHGHNLDTGTSLAHSHTWTTASVSTSSTGGGHTHDVNVQPIYFIIKY
jgi:microcystin-dependent protein